MRLIENLMADSLVLLMTPERDIREKRIEQSKETTNMLYGDVWKSIQGGIADVSPDLADYIQEMVYGEIYNRSGLSNNYREISAITALTILGLDDQLKTHVKAAISVGVTASEIRELMIFLTPFIGIPKVLASLKAINEMLKRYEEKKKPAESRQS